QACGISTLSQSPMLGLHKQMDNRIKLLEEILSFRMQGVEFDNGDMYVDGHKAASDVRDEFVSVTEKLMDELAQCYNVLPQLDINNTIDHRPEGDEKWFLENEKTIIFIEARINLSRFVVTGCAAKTSATVTFPSLNLISLFAFCFNIWLNGVAS